MSFFDKMNKAFFGNISSKVSFLTKLIMILELVSGIILIITGIVKYKFFTYLSYGLGMTDTSVRMGATYMLIGICVALGGWLLGLLVLGFNKIIARAEFEEEMEEEYLKSFGYIEGQEEGKGNFDIEGNEAQKAAIAKNEEIAKKLAEDVKEKIDAQKAAETTKKEELSDK